VHQLPVAQDPLVLPLLAQTILLWQVLLAVTLLVLSAWQS
jgi:hypothetical protein